MSKAGPSATGTLAATPLAGLLIYALERTLDGSLVFEGGDGSKSALTLRAGRLVNSRLASAKHRLGDLCVRLGLLTPQELQAASEQAAGRVFGEALLQQGLEPNALQGALTEQMLLHVETIAAMPGDTVYGFYPGKDFLERWGTERPNIEPLSVVWAAARAAPVGPALEMAKRLQQLPVLRLHRHSRVGRFGFSARESAILDVLRARPLSYPELGKLGIATPEETARVMYVLALTRHLDVGADALPIGVERTNSGPPKPPAESASSATAVAAAGAAGSPANLRAAAGSVGKASAAVAAVAPSANDGQRVEEITSLFERLDSLDYYALLGVTASADQNAIQGGFFQLARKWHPDKLPPSLVGETDRVTRIFTRITEAHRVLTNPQQRAEYDRLNAAGGDTEDEQAKVQQVLRAATAFQKAEVSARRGEWAQAAKFAEQANADDSEQSEYRALLAYARVKTGVKDPSELDRAIVMLTASVEQQPKNIRVKLYRAHVFKQAGKQNEAMRDFRAVAEAEPNNVEAQRELRLFKMRRGEAPGGPEEKPEKTGLIGKLFRSKE
jgi:curved DNA-binding protein CbpA